MLSMTRAVGRRAAGMPVLTVVFYVIGHAELRVKGVTIEAIKPLQILGLLLGGNSSPSIGAQVTRAGAASLQS
jgi:hypothetical protein